MLLPSQDDKTGSIYNENIQIFYYFVSKTLLFTIYMD